MLTTNLPAIVFPLFLTCCFLGLLSHTNLTPIHPLSRTILSFTATRWQTPQLFRAATSTSWLQPSSHIRQHQKQRRPHTPWTERPMSSPTTKATITTSTTMLTTTRNDNPASPPTQARVLSIQSHVVHGYVLSSSTSARYSTLSPAILLPFSPRG